VGLEDIIKKRMGANALGFSRNDEKVLSPEEMMHQIAPEDLVRFGMIPEFIGRLPVISLLDQLQIADLQKILLQTKNAMVKQYSKLFAMDGVRLRFTDDAIKAIAQKAIDLKTGARALRSIMEKLMLEVMYELPQRTDVAEVVVDAGVVAGRKRPSLKRRPKSVSKNAA
jgi:ATP-dependent Clp protease ATP-binding subunit ClpX